MKKIIKYTKHQEAVMDTIIDLLKKGAYEVTINKSVFGFVLVVRGYKKEETK